MKLRPHHLLCLQKYTGKGYDEAFTAHMNGLLGRLAAHPEEEGQLTEGADDLCAACPHNAGGRCDSQEKVTRMDRGVLAALDLSYGQRDSWGALARRAAHPASGSSVSCPSSAGGSASRRKSPVMRVIPPAIQLEKAPTPAGVCPLHRSEFFPLQL